MTYGSRLDEWFGKHVSGEIAQFGEEEAYRFSAVLAGADERGLVVSYHGGTDYLIQKHSSSLGRTSGGSKRQPRSKIRERGGR